MTTAIESEWRMRGIWTGGAKRCVDFVLASIALVVLAPLLAIVALAVRVILGKPVLFRQERPGLHGRLYTVYKFRTMNENRGPDGALLPARARLTTLGRLLRRTSIDEVPELINVVKGEMSLVGPRPLFTEYLGHYTPEQFRRHEVRPGITGLAQVHGRNALAWEERFALDVWYVDHLSPWLDLKILLQTVWHVVTQAGMVQPGEGSERRFGDDEE